jgi:hypothetical protein
MIEKQPEDSQDSSERDRLVRELNCTNFEAFDWLEGRRKDNWEAVNKALYTLIVGHAAGLVACMTLLKDYNATSPGHLKGLGWFITLFGLGLFLAVVSAAVWIVGRFNYWIFPLRLARALARARVIRITGKRWDIPRDKRDWWMAALALISTFLMALAILIAVCKFGTL